MGNQRANLFITGEQKTGTTTLHNMLSHHSDIYMSPIKEPGFFCTDLHEDSDKHNGPGVYFPIRTDNDYSRLYTGSTDQRYLGEASSLYLYSTKASRNISEYNPNAKMIMIFREPVSFLYSLHSQYMIEGGESIKNFGVALSTEELRRSGENLPENTRSPKLLFYSERVKYSQNLNRYYKIFDDKNILVIISDNFKNDPEGTYRSVLKFLGLQFEKVPSNNMNIGGVPRNNFLQSLTTSKGAQRLKNLIASKLSPDQVSKIVNRYHKISRKKSDREKIDSNLQMDLMKKYKHEVFLLEELLDEKGYDYELQDIWGY